MSPFASTSAMQPARVSNNENDDSVLKNRILNTLAGVVAHSLDDRRMPADMSGQLSDYKKENVKLYSDNQQLLTALTEAARNGQALGDELKQLSADKERLMRENDALRANLDEVTRQFEQLKQVANPSGYQKLVLEHARTLEELQRHKLVLAEMYQQLQQHEMSRVPPGLPHVPPMHATSQSQAHVPSQSLPHRDQPMPMQHASSAPLPQHIPPHLTYEQLMARQRQAQEEQAHRVQLREQQLQQHQRDLQQQQLQNAMREQSARQVHHSPPQPGQVSGPSTSGSQHGRVRSASQRGMQPISAQMQGSQPPVARPTNDGGRGFLVMPERRQLMINTALGPSSVPAPPLSAPPPSGTTRQGMQPSSLSDADRSNLSVAQYGAQEPPRQQGNPGAAPLAMSQAQSMAAMRDFQQRQPQPPSSSQQGPPGGGLTSRAMIQQQQQQLQGVGPSFRPFHQPQPVSQPMGPPLPPQAGLHSNMTEGFRPPRPHDMTAFEMSQRAALGLGAPAAGPTPPRSRQSSTSSVAPPAPSHGGPGHARSASATNVASSLRHSSYGPASPMILGPGVSNLKRSNETAAMREPPKRQRTISEQQMASAGPPAQVSPQMLPPALRQTIPVQQVQQQQPVAGTAGATGGQQLSALQASESASGSLQGVGALGRAPSEGRPPAPEQSSVSEVSVKQEAVETSLMELDRPPPPNTPLTPAFDALALRSESEAPRPVDHQRWDGAGGEEPAPTTSTAEMQPFAEDEGMHEEDEAMQEEDEIRRDADGLQVESDCVCKIIGVEEDWGQVTECEQCNLLNEQGPINAPSRFDNPTYEELLEHCKTQHIFVWDDLRAGKF